MAEKRRTLMILFGTLLVMMLGGILVHQITGYQYPATKANDYEFNTLNDLYELFVFLPVGLIALWQLRRGSQWGPVIISGAAIWTIYNYAMMVTGMQNLWIFLWTAKLAISTPILLLAWQLLPAKPSVSRKFGYVMVGYMAIIGIAFGKLMIDRLFASARGEMVNMAMVGVAKADWADPALRDPIIFFVTILPLLIAAISGIIRKTDDGTKYTTLIATFIIGIVSVILFTGPLKELLVSGVVSQSMMGMSVFMALFTVPSIYWLIKK